MDLATINIAINSLIVLTQVLSTTVQNSGKLTDEEKKIFLARLDVARKALQDSKFPVDETGEPI